MPTTSTLIVRPFMRRRKEALTTTTRRRRRRTNVATVVRATNMDEYERKGKGGFVGGVLIGGAVFGALGFLFAPQLSKHILKGKKVLDDLLDDDDTDDEESFLEEEEEDRDDVAHNRYDEDGNPTTSALASSSMRLEKRAEKELEETRKSLNQKIAELNRAIDEFSEEADARLTAKLGRLSDERFVKGASDDV